jgi:hypothetical protein
MHLIDTLYVSVVYTKIYIKSVSVVRVAYPKYLYGTYDALQHTHLLGVAIRYFASLLTLFNTIKVIQL